MNGLRYSDRTALAERGSLGDSLTESVPDTLRTAIVSVCEQAYGDQFVGRWFENRLAADMSQHLGRTIYAYPSPGRSTPRTIFGDRYGKVEDFVDCCEILIEAATHRWSGNHQQWGSFERVALPDCEDRVNRAMVRHRFGFRFEGGQARRVGSPALDRHVVGPALLAVSRPGWEQADRSFREALNHQRGGDDEIDDAIAAAHAALEAALKAAGLSGDRLGPLAKSLKSSGLVPSQLTGVPDALDVLLKRSSSLRDSMSDVHGKPPGAAEVPREVADLSIFWTGAFINYLAAAADRNDSGRGIRVPASASSAACGNDLA